jgi:hypothetical protein
VGIDPLGDRFRVPPGDHGVDQPIAAIGGEILGAEAGPLPGAQVVGQGQVEGDVLAADPAGLGWILLQQHGLLDCQQRPAAQDRPRPAGSVPPPASRSPQATGQFPRAENGIGQAILAIDCLDSLAEKCRFIGRISWHRRSPI